MGFPLHGAIGVSRPNKGWMGMSLVPLVAGCSLLGGGDPGPTPQDVARLAAEDVRIRREGGGRLAAAAPAARLGVSPAWPPRTCASAARWGHAWPPSPRWAPAACA